MKNWNGSADGFAGGDGNGFADDSNANAAAVDGGEDDHGSKVLAMNYSSDPCVEQLSLDGEGDEVRLSLLNPMNDDDGSVVVDSRRTETYCLPVCLSVRDLVDQLN